MTCAREGCDVPLTPRQIREGNAWHSRRCAGLARRRPTPPGRPTTCRRAGCATPLTWRQQRDGGFCSRRCAIHDRVGTVRPPGRTTCANCGDPLTREQQWRRREFCRNGCAKSVEWTERPATKWKAVTSARASQRRAFAQRLRAYLLTGPSREDVARRGFERGWGAGRRRALREGAPRPPHVRHAEHRAVIAAIAASAPSLAEVYRRSYAEGFARAWRHGMGTREAAA